MVLAGPGSGKTSVIVERTAYMTTEGGISPSNILVVTFSRAAAKEMKERFLNFTGQEYTPITFGTFPWRFLWDPQTGVWIYSGKYPVRGGEVCNPPGTCAEPWRRTG